MAPAMTRLGFALSLVFCLAVPAAVGAQDLTPAVKHARKDDYKKYCVGSRLRPGGATKCMRAHAALLSDNCKIAWAASHPPDQAAPANDARAH